MTIGYDPNKYWYDPLTKQTTRDQFIQEMQRQNMDFHKQMLGVQGSLQDPSPKPISQPEPFLNPVLLLLE